MAIYKELYLDKDAIIFLTFHEQNIIAVWNVDDIMSAIEDEINEYMKENDLKMVNVITSNDFNIYNIEKDG